MTCWPRRESRTSAATSTARGNWRSTSSSTSGGRRRRSEGLRCAGVRILFVTQMWPGPDDPDLGAFLVPIVRKLEALGHEVELVTIDRRGGSRAKYARLTGDAVRAARRTRPDVVFAHMLFPAGAAGAIAARSARAGLVVMAHGQDVANLGRIPGVRGATRWVVGHASGVIANSRWLADRLVQHVPVADAKLEIANCGIDLEAFSPQAALEARREVGWDGEGPAFLCVGSLIERKNVVTLADAFGELGRGRLAFVGDGTLRGALEGRPGVRVTGRVPHGEVRTWLAACDVLCQPSLREPFGQALLEAMAMERSVLGTTVGGPPEFVPPEAGVLVDPSDPAGLVAALERAAALPSPNPAAREAAAKQDVRVQVARMAAVLERAARGTEA
ncbi:MAG TPA: glycosyltransferase [Solirubrobacterales bacterium]|nr:glycosyltransferase [Solirubrobacterales bacterium]